MLLRPTINQLYLLSIAPSNRPPHLKQPPSPNLPFSPSESIHQIIYPSNTRKACLPRQGFSAFSIRLPPHPFFHQTHPVHLPLPKAGQCTTSPTKKTPTAPAPAPTQPLAKHPKADQPSTKRTTSLSPSKFFSPPFSIRIHPRPSCYQMRLARICPRLAGHTQSAIHKFALFTYAFFNRDTSTNHPSSNACRCLPRRVIIILHPLYIRNTIHNHLAAKCVSTCPC